MFVLFLVKTVWIVLIVTGVLFPCAVIIIIIYFVHKRRKCTRKDKRSKFVMLSVFKNSGVTIKHSLFLFIWVFFFCILLRMLNCFILSSADLMFAAN